MQGILSRQKCDDSLFTLSSFVYFSCVKFDLINGGPFTDMHHLVWNQLENYRRCDLGVIIYLMVIIRDKFSYLSTSVGKTFSWYVWSESLSSHNTRPLIWGPTLIDRHWLSITHWTLQESCTLAGSVRFLITWLWSADPFISVVNLTYRLHVSVNEKHKSWQWFSLDWDLRSRYWPEQVVQQSFMRMFSHGISNLIIVINIITIVT